MIGLGGLIGLSRLSALSASEEPGDGVEEDGADVCALGDDHERHLLRTLSHGHRCYTGYEMTKKHVSTFSTTGTWHTHRSSQYVRRIRTEFSPTSLQLAHATTRPRPRPSPPPPPSPSLPVHSRTNASIAPGATSYTYITVVRGSFARRVRAIGRPISVSAIRHSSFVIRRVSMSVVRTHATQDEGRVSR